MISSREIEKIRREMRGLQHCSIPTEILTELLYEYEKQHPEVRSLQLVDLPKSNKKPEDE